MKGSLGYPARLHYTKRGKVRFLGHRDVARNLERALRVARLPLAFTEGFSPHPKISFGLALTTGFESDAEYLDLEFTEPVDLDALPDRLAESLPPGIEVLGAAWLDDRAPALQEAVTTVVWQVAVRTPDDQPADPRALGTAVRAALGRDRIDHTLVRKGRTQHDDLRPRIHRLEVMQHRFTPDGAPILEMELASTGAKPAEIVAAIGPFVAAGGTRTHQYIERDGERRTPLHVDTCPAPRVTPTPRREEVLAS